MNEITPFCKKTRFFQRKIILISQLLILTACSSAHILVDTPNLYVNSNPFQDVAEGFETTSPELFFVTDRQVEGIDSTRHYYGTDRSSSIAFGTAKVQFGQNLSWDALAAASVTQSLDHSIILNVTEVNEIVRFPEVPLPFRVENGKAVILPESSAAYGTAIRSMQSHLQERLGASKQKDILLYVHGVNTEFNDAALNLADVWHFTRRHGIPIFYSWPAANKGMFGYFKDRESGEFSIYHVKETIRMMVPWAYLNSSWPVFVSESCHRLIWVRAIG